MRKIIILTLVAFFAVAISVNADVTPGKTGTSGAQFLKIGVGARATAMGGSYDAAVDDVEAVFWNPAGLVGVENNSVTVSDTEWIADTRLISAGFARNMGFGVLGISTVYMMYGDMDETTIGEPYGTGNTFTASDMAVGVSFGRRLTDRFSVGGTAKFIRQAIADDSAMGVAFDIGTQYDTGFKSLKMAIALQNLGPEMKFGSTYFEKQRDPTDAPIEEEFAEYSLPVLVRLGVTYTFFDSLNVNVTGGHPNDGSERLFAGAEYWIKDMIALRGGVDMGRYQESYSETYNADTGQDEFKLRPSFDYTAGLGVKLSFIKADFAYKKLEGIDEPYTLMISVGSNF